MAKYLNGQEGDEPTREFFGHRKSYSVVTDPDRTIDATPETVETLLTTICAWGSQHIVLPFETLDMSVFEPMGHTSLLDAAQNDPELGFRCTAPTGTPATVLPEPGSTKRQKRRQGVACDTCRLRRVRCDLMEQPPGVKACSRCRVKQIVCTDRYIQWRRGRDMMKNAGASRSMPGVQLLPHREEFVQLNELPSSIRSLSQQELIDYGVSREAVYNHFVRRALILVHRHNIVNSCTIQGTIVLTMLASLLDYTRPKMAYESQRVASQHVMSLFRRSEFDLGCVLQCLPLSDQFARLSGNRLPQSTWVYDAVSNVSYLRKPHFPRNFYVVGFRGGLDATVNQLPVSDVMDVCKQADPVSAISMYLLLSQFIGVVAHDAYESMMSLPALQTIPPTMASVAEIRSACHRLWNDLHQIELCMHILADKMRETYRLAFPMNMLLWGWLLLSLNFLLHQAIARRVTEWFSSTKAYHQWAMYSEEEQTEPLMEAIHDLLRESQLCTLGISRTIAHYARNLLPTGLLFRGSSMIRQLFRVTQCIARALPVSDESAEPHQDEPEIVPGPTSLHSLLNPTAGAPPPSMPASPTETLPFASPHDMDLLLSIPDSRSHEPFTRRTKRREIDGCIRGLGQIGFSQAGIDVEIRRIIDLVHFMR
ncbi:hypothetical protein MEQU1_002732 [Malassezia equina]|uniref:Zn(2)-C6 fungal-type domain-containing protein n=1 Tax=Malassezia equina TaxID=1381935 RepID=A0AAF0EG71_9BASI|nr:hypothetical protein MEQU1_002732 [Malassezia equina]